LLMFSLYRWILFSLLYLPIVTNFIFKWTILKY
jgi:hypothetical protein